MDNKELIECWNASDRHDAEDMCKAGNALAYALERAEAELAKYRSAPTVGYLYEFSNGGAVVGQYRIDAGQWPVDDKPTAIHELIIRPEAP